MTQAVPDAIVTAPDMLTLRTRTADGRLLARFVMLTQRFGVGYREATAERDSEGTFTIRIVFVGNDDALRRLTAQLTKILDYEKELA